MSDSITVLILGNDAACLAAQSDALQADGISSIRATRAREAIDALREKNIDMILVDARMERPSATEFLAKARELLPHIPRALWEDSPGTLDLRTLINEAAPQAVFTGPVDTGRIGAIVQESRKLSDTSASQSRIETQAQEIQQLKTRLIDTQRQLSHSAQARPAELSPAPKSKAPVPPIVTTANRPGDKFSLAGAHHQTDTEQAATHAAIAAANQTISTILPTGGTMDFDLMAADATAEMARVMNRMLEEPELRLPVLPRIGQEVRKLMADPNSNFEQIAQVVGLELSMSARILEVANSPMYGAKEPIRSVQNAVSRIGMQETRNILQAVAGENMFRTSDKRLAILMAKLWIHSLAVAYSNEILARTLLISESDDFFMMGLLHDIGKLLILHLAQMGITRKIWTKNTATPEMLTAVFDRYHNTLGLRLMEKWDYPESFHKVIGLHNDDARVHEYDEAVVVTYYSNILTRKLGFSLREYDESLINNHQIAQALNMNETARAQIEQSVAGTLAKMRESYM